jgi:hypothetical protein
MEQRIGCISAGGRYHELEVAVDRPAKISVRDSHGQKVDVRFRLLEGGLYFHIGGEGLGRLNQQTASEGRLGPGDELAVGGVRFVLAVTEKLPGPLPTPLPLALGPLARAAALAVGSGPVCSICGAPAGTAQVAPPWSEGRWRICAACWDVGRRPQHIAGWAGQLEVDLQVPIEDGATRPPTAPAPAHSPAESPRPLRRGGPLPDPTTAYPTPPTLVPISPVPVADPPPPRGPASNTETLPIPEPQGSRQSRRITASKEANPGPSEPAGRKPLLARMQEALRRRDDGELKRLEKLEDERTRLLEAAGRLALERQGGIGLPEGVLADLGKGRSVLVDPAQLHMGDLLRFREHCKRLAWLDAEIAALAAGLSMDTVQVTEPATPLGSEQRDLEGRAFQASDGLRTEELSYDVDTPPRSNGSGSQPSSISGRRLLRRRRR